MIGITLLAELRTDKRAILQVSLQSVAAPGRSRVNFDRKEDREPRMGRSQRNADMLRRSPSSVSALSGDERNIMLSLVGMRVFIVITLSTITVSLA